VNCHGYHTVHFFSGFIGEFLGQSNASAKYLEFDMAPKTLKDIKTTNIK
jgi:tetrahydromethanopterin S-methyltransferase subunit D